MTDKESCQNILTSITLVSVSLLLITTVLSGLQGSMDTRNRLEASLSQWCNSNGYEVGLVTNNDMSCVNGYYSVDYSETRFRLVSLAGGQFAFNGDEEGL